MGIVVVSTSWGSWGYMKYTLTTGKCYGIQDYRQRESEIPSRVSRDTAAKFTQSVSSEACLLAPCFGWERRERVPSTSPALRIWSFLCWSMELSSGVTMVLRSPSSPLVLGGLPLSPRGPPASSTWASLGLGLESGLSPSLPPCLVPVSLHPHSSLSLFSSVLQAGFLQSSRAGLGCMKTLQSGPSREQNGLSLAPLAL